MTMDELFEHIIGIIERPSTGEEDTKRRAMQILICLDDYLIDAFPSYCEDDCEIDFGSYVAGLIDEMEGK